MFKIDLDKWDSSKLNIKVGKLKKSSSKKINFQKYDFKLFVAKVCSNNVNEIAFLKQKGFKVVCSELLLKRLKNNKMYKNHQNILINQRFNPTFNIKGFDMVYSRFFLDKKLRIKIYKTFWDQMIYEHIKNFADKNFYLLDKKKSKLKAIITCKINNKIIHLFHVNVQKNYQGKGIGSKLIEKIINYSKENNYALTTSVISTNKKAINLYKKYDFKIIDKYTILHKWA